MPLEGDKLDEFLNGYLDGQLDGQELRLVQQTLAASPEARARLQELEVVSASLRDFFTQQDAAQQDRSASAEVGNRRQGTVASPVANSHSDGERQREPAPAASSNGRSGQGASSDDLRPLKPRTTSPDFAARVIAEAQRRAVQAGLPDNHHVRLAEQEAIVDLADGHPQQAWGKILAVAAVAASLLLLLSAAALLTGDGNGDASLAVTSPDAAGGPIGGGDPTVTPHNESVETGGPATNPFDSVAASEATDNRSEGPEPTGEALYVSELQAGQFEYVLVVNVLLSRTGGAQLRGLLNDSGIPRDAPILVGPEVEETINEARMTVANRENTSDAMIYLIRADVAQLGHLLEGIYADSDHFPEVAFDLAVDDPQGRLLEKIARSTGQRFAVEKQFAAPIAIDADDLNGSSFPGWERPARLVSAEARTRGPAGLAAPMQEGNLNNVLLIVRSAR